jgi:putative acetyltransferase
MIREYRSNDLEGLISLFRRSVREINARHYSPDQINAWAPESPDLPAWRRRLSNGGVFLSEICGEIEGFVRLEESGHLDLLYVHPGHQRQGVGRQLVGRALSWAVERGLGRITSDVSITARPFFERLGFRVVAEQRIELNGTAFNNFHMERNVDV